MSSRFLGFALLVLLSGCGQRASNRGVARLAILPFENLTSKAELDWIGPLAPAVLVRQLVGAPGLTAISSLADHDLGGHRATESLRGYYQVEGGALRLRAGQYDIASNRAIRWFDERGPLSEGPLPLLNRISQAIFAKAEAFPATDAQALRLYGQALGSKAGSERASLAEQAFRKDQKLTPAALEAAAYLASAGSTAQAMALLSDAASHASGEWDKFQADGMLGALRHDGEQTIKALTAAAALSPANSDIARQLGELSTRRRDFAAAASWFGKASEAEPGHIGLLNLRAYAQAYGLDFAAAKKTTALYRDRAPGDPNSYDTSGEILWMAGEFAEASQNFVRSQEKDPQFNGGLEFAKAAFSLWMAEDAGADAMFQRYLETRRAFSDPLADLRQAHWLMLTGRAEQAEAAARKVAAAGGEAGSRALSFLSVWAVQQGKRDAAQQDAAKAVAMAQSPAGRAVAMLAALFAQPKASAEEWRKRTSQMLSGPEGLRDSTLAYALFLDGHYRESAQLLERLLVDSNPGTSDEMQAILAGAKLQLGDRSGAAKLLGRWPLPPQPGENPFASLWFPAVKQWRKQALP